MKKLLIACTCLTGLIWLSGCHKNDCQTNLQGAWIVSKPSTSGLYIIDSVLFFKGDSILEKYKTGASPDSFFYYPSSYYVNDQCSEIDFQGVNSWDQNASLQYRILEIRADALRIISKSDSGNCADCIVTFHR